MKTSIYLMILTLFLTISCAEEESSNETENNSPSTEETNQSNAYCPEMTFESPKAQAEAIIEAFQKASDSTNVDRVDAEKSFFCIFPSNYAGVKEIFGYPEEGEPLIDDEMGWEITDFFTRLKSIPVDVYYAKYIDLTVNGISEAEDPAYAFSVGTLIEEDPENAIAALSKKSPKDIESVFTYLYDEAEIGNLDMTFEYRQKILLDLSPELAAIHKTAYDKLKEKWKKIFDGE